MRNVHQLGNRKAALPALTFHDFEAMCRKAEGVRGPLPVHVQFRRNGEVLCGLVLAAAPARGGQTVDFFEVMSDVAVQWVPHYRVRACGGVDGRCVCEAADQDARQRGQGGGLGEEAPHGNTGVAT